nr:pre-mRNA splicing Prp18-interacting factor [Tanacetum cinerariifolium]
MSTFVLCFGCGTPLYGFSPCQWCTYERCGNDLRDGFCALCNSRNSCVYDPNPNSFDCSPDSYHPSHPTHETASGDSCGNNSHFGYDCLPRFSLNYEPEPGYTQNYNSYPHNSPSFPQQYLCCDNYGGPHETSQCQPMNQNFYNSNSFGFDQSQTPQFPDRVFKIKDALGNKQYKLEDIQELLRELFNDVQNIHEELAENINTPGWNRPAFCNNGDDDDEDCTIAITSDFSITNSLIMENEHLDIISETESDEFIKSSVENFVPIPSESEDFSDIESECDVPDCNDS